MNKRGDLGLTVLTIVSIFLAVYSLFTIVSFNGGYSDARALAEIAAEADIGQRYIARNAEMAMRDAILNRVKDCEGIADLKERYVCCEKKRELLAPLGGNFAARINAGSFSFGREGEDYVLNVTDVRIKTQSGENNLLLKANIYLRLWNNGDLLDRKVDFEEESSARIGNRVSA